MSNDIAPNDSYVKGAKINVNATNYASSNLLTDVQGQGENTLTVNALLLLLLLLARLIICQDVVFDELSTCFFFYCMCVFTNLF